MTSDQTTWPGLHSDASQLLIAMLAQRPRFAQAGAPSEVVMRRGGRHANGPSLQRAAGTPCPGARRLAPSKDRYP